LGRSKDTDTPAMPKFFLTKSHKIKDIIICNFCKVSLLMQPSQQMSPSYYNFCMLPAGHRIKVTWYNSI
jgi:hypothetical protein